MFHKFEVSRFYGIKVSRLLRMKVSGVSRFEGFSVEIKVLKFLGMKFSEF
jgi:hypothetical protein